MKLLYAIKTITRYDETIAERVRQCLEDRLDWLEMREPEYDGSIHDEWEDKRDDLEDIIEQFNDFEDESPDGKEDIWRNIRDDIHTYQILHGSLSRLTI